MPAPGATTTRRCVLSMRELSRYRTGGVTIVSIPQNIVQDGRLSLMFMVIGADAVVRING